MGNVKISDIQLYIMTEKDAEIVGIIAPQSIVVTGGETRILYEFIELYPNINDLISSGFGVSQFKCKKHPIKDWNNIRKMVVN